MQRLWRRYRRCMASLRIDHLYRETVHWVESVVLAEVASSHPASSVFLATDDLESTSRRVGSPVVDTHWETRMVSATDPDGRTYNFEPGDES